MTNRRGALKVLLLGVLAGAIPSLRG